VGGGAAATEQTTADDIPVIDDTLVSELPDPDVPTSGEPDADVNIDAEPSPAAGPGDGGAAWALMNLLLTIAAGLLMIWLLVRYFISIGHDKYRDMEHARERDKDRYTDMRVMSKAASWIVGVFCTIAAVLLFIFTENMQLPMEIVNRYTIFYVCAVVIELLFLAFSAKKRKRIYDETA
jgi:uncharacterized membrane protein